MQASYSVSYNGIMKVERLYDWQLNIDQVLGIQRRLQAQVNRSGQVVSPHFIAGVNLKQKKDLVAPEFSY
ncbi:MAG: hypothetical protein CL873_02445 [Dehalococcoidales bacterium]|nr:hypothetical protein [Dehalococcoidales bacterium]